MGEEGVASQGVSSGSTTITPVTKKMSADDLLNLYDEEAQSEKVSIQKEAERQAKIETEVPKKVVVEKLAKSLEASANREEQSNLGNQGGEENEKAKQEQEAAKEEVAHKVLKAKFGEGEIEIPEEALIPVKISNKDVQLKVKDAVQAFVRQDEFNRNMDRRLSIVDRREKDLSSEYEGIKEKAETVIRMASQGDFLLGIKALAEMAGLGANSDKIELERAMMNQLEQIRKVWGDMTPQQREVYFANRKAEELQRELERSQAKSAKVESEVQLSKQIKSLVSENQITEEVFWKTFQDLIEAGVGEGKPFTSPQEITPEDVIKYHKTLGVVNKVMEALGRIDSSLRDDPIADHIIELVGEQDFTSSDIEEIVRETLKSRPNKAVENLNRKVDLAKSKGLNDQLKQVSSTKKVSDIDEEMYSFFFNKRGVSPFSGR